MSHTYNVYIDESGDDGLAKFKEPGSHGGASHWLIIGACITRSSRDLELVSLRDKIKSECAPKKKGRGIHFADLNHGQKRRACQLIQGSPLRFSAVLGLKKTDAAAKAFREKNQLYFYLTRYLLERVSWLCRDKRPSAREGDGRAKIIFSRRGGLSYDDFRKYLKRLKDQADTTIHWPVIDIEAVEATEHSRLAGLQIADIGVSAIAAAIENDRFGNVEGRYLEDIGPNIYSRNGRFRSYGLKFHPDLNSIHDLTKEQAKAFSEFK